MRQEIARLFGCGGGYTISVKQDTNKENELLIALFSIRPTHAGKELRDIFLGSTLNKSGDDEEDDSEFKEPLEHEGKLRWQVIRLMPTKSRSPTRYEEACDTPTDSTRDQPERSKKTTVDSSNQVDEHDEEQREKEGDVSLLILHKLLL